MIAILDKFVKIAFDYLELLTIFNFFLSHLIKLGPKAFIQAYDQIWIPKFFVYYCTNNLIFSLNHKPGRMLVPYQHLSLILGFLKRWNRRV